MVHIFVHRVETVQSLEKDKVVLDLNVKVIYLVLNSKPHSTLMLLSLLLFFIPEGENTLLQQKVQQLSLVYTNLF